MPSFLSTSLGKFNPSRFHEVSIASEFQDWLRCLGIVSADKMLSKNRLPIEVRTPDDCLKMNRDIVSLYHRDGYGGYTAIQPTVSKNGIVRLSTNSIPSILWLIVWSNGTSTELMDDNWNEIRYSPCDVVLFNNHLMYHRSPPVEDSRWFIRLSNPVLPASMA